MIERLFVYGTLCPGQRNNHLLKAVGGSWQSATVNGTLNNGGWAAAQGCPAIILDEHGRGVEGFVFTSENLSDHWAALDEFEGEAYQRVMAKVKLIDGSRIEAYIYALNSG